MLEQDRSCRKVLASERAIGGVLHECQTEVTGPAVGTPAAGEGRKALLLRGAACLVHQSGRRAPPQCFTFDNV